MSKAKPKKGKDEPTRGTTTNKQRNKSTKASSKKVQSRTSSSSSTRTRKRKATDDEQATLPIYPASDPVNAKQSKVVSNGKRKELSTKVRSGNVRTSVSGVPKNTGNARQDGSSVSPEILPTIRDTKARTLGQALGAATTQQEPSSYPPHVVIEARAGTGKTSTLIWGLNKLKGRYVAEEPSEQQQAIWDAILESKGANSICFVAFNKSIATELEGRVPEGCDAMTMHRLGLRAITSCMDRPLKVNSFRTTDLISEVLDKPIGNLRFSKPVLMAATTQLVSLCKQNLVGITTNETDAYSVFNLDVNWEQCLTQLARYYDIDLNGSKQEVFDLVPKVLERCLAMEDGMVDFDDMVWLPIAKHLPLRKHELLLIDESQDLSPMQQQLAISSGSRLVFVGDSRQAIYGFAGADSQSMRRLKDRLLATEQGCKLLPLTVTRRCGKAIVEEAKKYVPDFEAHPTNPEGRVTTSFMDEYTKLVDEGDMVICRINAPLVAQCFKFLNMGRKATIQGRDIGKNLITLINKLKAGNTVDLVVKVREWCQQELAKENANSKPNEQKLINLEDKRDCVIQFTDGLSVVSEVVRAIENVFDDTTKEAIRLSSIHRAKGLEANKVWHIKPKGAECPHPMAKQPWAKEQDINCCYIAVTRAKEQFAYVTDRPKY